MNKLPIQSLYESISNSVSGKKEDLSESFSFEKDKKSLIKRIDEINDKMNKMISSSKKIKEKISKLENSSEGSKDYENFKNNFYDVVSYIGSAYAEYSKLQLK